MEARTTRHDGLMQQNFIFLSDGDDPYIRDLAAGAGGTVTSVNQFGYDSSTQPIVLRSILKYKIMNRCRADSRDFYYVDTGYFGNNISATNPRGLKRYHRIVKNGLQHNNSSGNWDNQRIKHLNLQFPTECNSGNEILIVAPGGKACKYYKTTPDSWIASTVEQLQAHTNRPINIRQKTKQRNERLNLPIEDEIKKSYAVVTHNSIAAVESVMLGKPVFITTTDNAALPVANTNLADIEKPFYPSPSVIYNWVCRLSYGQFGIAEMRNGTVWKYII